MEQQLGNMILNQETMMSNTTITLLAFYNDWHKNKNIPYFKVTAIA